MINENIWYLTKRFWVCIKPTLKLLRVIEWVHILMWTFIHNAGNASKYLKKNIGLITQYYKVDLNEKSNTNIKQYGYKLPGCAIGIKNL